MGYMHDDVSPNIATDGGIKVLLSHRADKFGAKTNGKVCAFITLELDVACTYNICSPGSVSVIRSILQILFDLRSWSCFCPAIIGKRLTMKRSLGKV